MVKYLTKEGLDKLKKELAHLEKVERKKISERLKEAIAQGDLKENAGYQVTKEDQVMLEKRITELREIINQAQIIKKTEGSVVRIGSFVSLESNKKKQKFQIVGPEEADIFNGKISFKSPLGSAILNKRKGDTVKIKTPEGEKEYKIIEVE